MGLFDDMMPYDPFYDFNRDGHIDPSEYAAFVDDLEEDERRRNAEDDGDDPDDFDDLDDDFDL